MPINAKTALAGLLVFGSATAVLGDKRTDHGSVAPLAASVAVSNGRTGVVNHVVKSLAAEETASFAAPGSALAPSASLCRRGVTDKTTAWIELTEPGGKPLHINVDQVTSVRSDTQIPGAKAQLDLASGKIQAVRENVDQVMQLITAPAGARTNDSCA